MNGVQKKQTSEGASNRGDRRVNMNANVSVRRPLAHVRGVLDVELLHRRRRGGAPAAGDAAAARAFVVAAPRVLPHGGVGGSLGVAGRVVCSRGKRLKPNLI